jgi:CotH kinase protein
VKGSLWKRLGCVALTACLTLGLAALPAQAEDLAASMYEPQTVDVIELGLTPTEQAKLEAAPDEYVKGTFSLATTNGTPGGEETLVTPTPVKAEIRLKGSTSFEPLSGKAAFKIKFKKTERFLGLRKMTLNNMVQDPSMVHEALAYSAFRAAGVPASRTGYAYVKVNGEDFGLELNLETVDVDSLEKRFGAFDEATQHLYEGEDGHDVTPGGAKELEVDEGSGEDIADLEALIAAVNSEGSLPWSTRVAPYADLQEMTKMWAVEKYVGQWDGYAGQVGEKQPNNYYLYSEPSGRFQMIPWGLDETWEESRHIPFDGEAGLLFDKCLADATCAALYWNSLSTASDAIGGLGLDGLAVELAELLEPWQQIEHANNRHEYTLPEIKAGVAGTRAYLNSRTAEASAWLAAHVPLPTPEPATAPPPAALGQQQEAQGEVIRVQAAAVTGRFLRTSLQISSPGLVSQRASFSTGVGSFTACSVQAGERPAGQVTLSCRLSAAALAHLQRRWLRITIVTRVRTSDGEAKTFTRQITVPRV